ncbi:hypothetical protein Q5P01_005654 [Channa striata]|uniref:Uncharacterized protein n=1 Tax=Channa striata TaxID=64152 RepID=A0AA88ND59_CHASR|nr:hypothetical protein Q5P01_005654 [Channa striata]
MDLQSRIQSLKRGVEFFEGGIKYSRKEAKIFKEIYLSADRKFEEYLKGLSHGQDTGECSEDFPSENHFLLAEMKKLFAKRNELLAEIGTLVAEGEEESMTYLQINIKFLEMLIECEKEKTQQFRITYLVLVEDSKEALYHLNEQMRGGNVEIVFKYEPQPPQGETLLAQRGKQSSCSGTAGEKKKPNATESQKTIDQLQSKLTILEIYLEYEKCDTAKYKQLILKIVEKFEEMLNTIKQRPSTCRCDPSIRPVRHRHGCNVAFTRDDAELLRYVKRCLTGVQNYVVKLEQTAADMVAAVTDEARQEAAKSSKHSECTVLCSPSCSGHHSEKRQSSPIVSDDRINYLISKLNMLKVQYTYEKAVNEKWVQLYMIVGDKFEELLNEVKRRSLCTDVESRQEKGECSRNLTDENNHLLANTEFQMIVMGKQMLWMRSKLAETTMGPSERKPVAVTEVRQEGGERKEAVLQTSSAPENQPLLTQTENLSMDENTPGDTVNVTEGSVKSQKV